jgi:uncharacterized protein (TIGR03083 family)
MGASHLHPQIEALRVGWKESILSTIALGKRLGEEEWLLPSPCPGWRLKDLISHLVGIEEFLLNPNEGIVSTTAERTWVKNDFGRFNEVAVELRRGRHGSDILAELEIVVEARDAAWRLEERSPETEVLFAPVGVLPLSLLLFRRVFDVWAHNQDLRMPLGLAGGLDGKAATIVYSQIATLLPATFAKRCAARVGSSIWIAATGPGAFTYGAAVNENGRGEFLKARPEDPTASIQMSTHDWYLLTCGRDGREKSALKIEGDQELAQKVIANFVITP